MRNNDTSNRNCHHGFPISVSTSRFELISSRKPESEFCATNELPVEHGFKPDSNGVKNQILQLKLLKFGSPFDGAELGGVGCFDEGEGERKLFIFERWRGILMNTA
jgi:hypothetical protein